MKVVKIGFIGAGFMSQIAHLPSFYDDKRVNIVALSELNKRLLQKVSKKYQIKKIYKSYKDMIAIEKLDGCDHMTCDTASGADYLGAIIPPSNPRTPDNGRLERPSEFHLQPPTNRSTLLKIFCLNRTLDSIYSSNSKAL